MARLFLWMIGGAALALFGLSRTQTGGALVASVGESAEAVSEFIGEGLRKLLGREEGLRLDVYQDEGGRWTIGYGHLVAAGDPYYPFGSVDSITVEEAERLAAQDTATAANCVDRNVMVALTPNQRDALISFVFNVGCGAFGRSTLLQHLNASDYLAAAAEFEKWVKITDKATGTKFDSPILIGRRDRERELFLA